MKHSHHHEYLRIAGIELKQARPASTHSTTRAVTTAGASDDSQTESKTVHPTGNSPGNGALSDQQRLELRQAAERNKDFLNPLQSYWPTRSSS